MKHKVATTVNGRRHEHEVEPRLLLVHYLRETLGLTGTHWGCDTSNCGACVVHLDGRPVKSCTTLAASCDGHEVRTIESMEVDGRLDPVQQGFHEEHGLQCGFCTPGMIMTARALLDEPCPVLWRQMAVGAAAGGAEFLAGTLGPLAAGTTADDDKREGQPPRAGRALLPVLRPRIRGANRRATAAASVRHVELAPVPDYPARQRSRHARRVRRCDRRRGHGSRHGDVAANIEGR